MLQEKHGLLYGPNAADHLAVVSGGSYTAAAHVLTAAQAQRQDPPPVADGAPETEHIVSHGRYLVEDCPLTTVWRFGWRGVVNLIAAALLLLWTTVMIADIVVIVDRLTPVPTFPESARVFAVVAFFGSIGCLGIATMTDRTGKQLLYGGVGLAGMTAAAPTVSSTVSSFALLSSPKWWWTNWTATTTAIGLFLAATIVSALAALGRRVIGPARDFSEIVTRMHHG